MIIQFLMFMPALTPALSPREREYNRTLSDNSSAFIAIAHSVLLTVRCTTTRLVGWLKAWRMALPLLGERAGVRASVFTDHRRTHLLVLLSAIIWILISPAMAADFANAFSAANKLYAEGKFAEAAAGYEKILQTGQVSPALYFNYGNAEFKSGNLGRAIAAYRRAARLAPRDAEVRANLEFARDQVTGPTRREGRWANWLGTLTLNEWAALTAIAFWLTFGLLAAGQLRPALKPALRNLTLGAAIATLLAGTALGGAAALQFSRETVVVVAPDVTVRSGPFDEAQSAFTAQNGAELAVLDRRNDWVQATDGAGRIGWLPEKQVHILPGG
jgi:tetratricopeptide (TPR) repeat protein